MQQRRRTLIRLRVRAVTRQQTLKMITLDTITLDTITLDTITLDTITLDTITLDTITQIKQRVNDHGPVQR